MILTVNFEENTEICQLMRFRSYFDNLPILQLMIY